MPAGVEPEQDERRRLIVEGLDAIGGWRDPAGVLEEVVFLVESPTVLEGRFDERFLELPPRVVETAMQSHQRYFPLEGARFAFVANGGEPEVVVAGNERVLEGRLEDAHFTFERDVAKGIEALAAELGSITFVAGAGSFADKAARLQALVGEQGGGEASREAARLAKADQAAELVREFPDLEGHIGAEYARLAGFPEGVCAAIEEQYLPDSADGPLPQTEPGRVLAAAEKVDNLTVAFALGQRPTGSRDPYGLRRAAIGLCRIAVEGGLQIDVGALVQRDLGLLVRAGGRASQDDAVGRRRLRLRAARGRARRARRVRAGRPRRRASPSWARSPTWPARWLPRRRRRSSSGPTSPSTARTGWPGRADGAASALDPALATDEAEMALIEALGERLAADRGGRRRARLQRRRSPRPPSSARRSTASSTRCSSWPRTSASAPTGFGSSSTSATRSARSATSRRSRGSGMADPVELHVVSDSTGETAARVVDAVEAQFPGQEFEVVRHPRIAAVEDVHLAAQRARGRRAVVLFTLVEPELREVMRTLCKRYRLHYCDLLGHPIEAVARVSGAPATVAPVPARCSTRATSSASRRSSSPSATTTAPARTSCMRPTSSSSGSRAARRRRSRCIWRISGTRPPTCRS